MTRRRVGIAVTATLIVAAVSLGSVAAFVHLSPTDYRLLSLLRKTKTVEVSTHEHNWAIVEVRDPALVARVIQETSRLERQRVVTASRFLSQVRFTLDDGGYVTLGFRPDGQEYRVEHAVRFPGESDFFLFKAKEQDTFEELLDHLFKVDDVHLADLGALGSRYGNKYCVSFSEAHRGIVVEWVLRAGEVKQGVRTRIATYISEDPRTELAKVRITLDGRTTTIPLPPIRFHEPLPGGRD